MIESTFEILKKAEIFLQNNNKSEKETEEVIAKALAIAFAIALAIAEKFQLEVAKNISLFPGVVEVLGT